MTRCALNTKNILKKGHMITLDNIITIHPVKMHIYSFVFNNNKIKFFVQKSYIPRKIKELKFIIIYTLWPNYKYLQSFKKLCAANLEKLLWPTNKKNPVLTAGLTVGRVKNIIPSPQLVLYYTYKVLHRLLSSNLLVQPMNLLQFWCDVQLHSFWQPIP